MTTDALFPFDNSYARLPERFFARLAPTRVARPGLIRVNEELARDLGLRPEELTTPEGTARRQLKLAAGANESVHLEVKADQAGPGERRLPPPDEPTEDGPVSLIPFSIVGFAVGGVGMLGFAIFGSLTLSEYSKLEEKCPTNSCRPEISEEADDGRTYQTAANVSLVIGAVGLAAGTGLLITALMQDDGGEADTAGMPSISVGPGSLFVSGTF